MSKAQRDKGRRGECAAKKLLRNLGWTIDPISSGIKREDMIATDPNGKVWCVEVKNCKAITVAHREQAMYQAHKRGLPWLLMSKISGTSFWLVQRSGYAPIVWAENELRFLI